MVTLSKWAHCFSAMIASMLFNVSCDKYSWFQVAVDQCLRPFTAYALFYLLLGLFPMISRVHEMNAGEPSLTLNILHRLASNSYGLWIIIMSLIWTMFLQSSSIQVLVLVSYVTKYMWWNCVVLYYSLTIASSFSTNQRA